MDQPEPRETPADPPAERPRSSNTFVIVMMLLALACVAITAIIAFYDMSRPP